MNLFEQSLEEEKITGKLELEEYEEKNIRETEILKAEISYKTQSMDIESILNSLKNSYFVLPKYHTYVYKYITLNILQQTICATCVLYQKLYTKMTSYHS